MTGFTKLFGSILASTIWDEDKDTKILWITMLAMSDQHGQVEGSIPGLAHQARLGISETETALKKLLAPDPYSRSRDHDGRRIAKIEGGWLILNHLKYRNKMSEDDRRERDRERQRRHRSKASAVTCDVTPECDRSRLSRKSRHTEAEAEADTNRNSSPEQKPCSGQAPATSRPKQTSASPSQQACGLALLLESEIRRNKPDAKITRGQIRSWGKTADRMIRLDDRDPDQIAEVIRWVQHDEFEHKNVLSMDKLRTRFDQLEMKANPCSRQPTVVKPVSAVEQIRKSLGVATRMEGAAQ